MQFEIGSKVPTLTMNIPDDLAAELGAGFQDLVHAALEAFARTSPKTAGT